MLKKIYKNNVNLNSNCVNVECIDKFYNIGSVYLI